VVSLGMSPEEARMIANAQGEAEVILLRIPDRSVAPDFRSGIRDAA
jgi:hypothetical protein